MREITYKQKRAIMAIIGKRGLDKEATILAATNDRTESVRQMNFEEAKQLLDKLGAKPKADPCLPMVKKIYSCMHEMRITLPNRPKQVDVVRMNELIKKHGHIAKPLDEYTYEELPKLVWQVEQMRDHYLKPA